jgi:Mn2+/Fe2+ NRAMP family transporter
MNDKEIMGSYSNSKLTNAFGAVVILITVILGVKGILSATNFL